MPTPRTSSAPTPSARDTAKRKDRWISPAVPYFRVDSASAGVTTRRPAVTTATTAFAARWTRGAELGLGVRLAFGARNLLAGRLIDDLHRQTRLAAFVKAQELDVDLLAFLDDLADGGGTSLG